jgi:hypothetical protein
MTLDKIFETLKSEGKYIYRDGSPAYNLALVLSMLGHSDTEYAKAQDIYLYPGQITNIVSTL